MKRTGHGYFAPSINGLCSKRIKPMLPALQGMDHGLRTSDADLKDLIAALAPLLEAKDEDMSSVFRACLDACEQLDEDAWQPVVTMPLLVTSMTIATVITGENFCA